MTQTMHVATFRLVHKDANDNVLGTILEKHSSEFQGAAGAPNTDPQKMPKVKVGQSPIIREDEKLVIQMKQTTALTEHTTSTAATNTVRIPVLVYNMRTRNEFEKTLTATDFTDLKPYVSSAVWAITAWYDVFSYTLPAQLRMRIGHRVLDERVDSALNLQKDSTTS
jgi:hypothetical protein